MFSTPRPFDSATSIRHGFAFTTGRVTLYFFSSDGGGPGSITLIAQGHDELTTTAQGAVVRNIGLVAGSYTKRTSNTGVRFRTNLHGIQLKMTVPEPETTLMLLAGVGALGFLVWRRG